MSTATTTTVPPVHPTSSPSTISSTTSTNTLTTTTFSDQVTLEVTLLYMGEDYLSPYLNTRYRMTIATAVTMFLDSRPSVVVPRYDITTGHTEIVFFGGPDSTAASAALEFHRRASAERFCVDIATTSDAAATGALCVPEVQRPGLTSPPQASPATSVTGAPAAPTAEDDTVAAATTGNAEDDTALSMALVVVVVAVVLIAAFYLVAHIRGRRKSAELAAMMAHSAVTLNPVHDSPEPHRSDRVSQGDLPLSMGYENSGTLRGATPLGSPFATLPTMHESETTEM